MAAVVETSLGSWQHLRPEEIHEDSAGNELRSSTRPCGISSCCIGELGLKCTDGSSRVELGWYGTWWHLHWQGFIAVNTSVKGHELEKVVEAESLKIFKAEVDIFLSRPEDPRSHSCSKFPCLYVRTYFIQLPRSGKMTIMTEIIGTADAGESEITRLSHVQLKLVEMINHKSSDEHSSS
ncbi:uncharacterized protein LOC132209586 [Stegostoma tigrinum]|uniref:uncharacterized protein LOC132209586 n=1 Tax=Stegostoma tigrinum TaxID=3053191 RepID=UPI002870B199|nr:uncharacterized protein LOC132209586 [Stegostoma tigrinum]